MAGVVEENPVQLLQGPGQIALHPVPDPVEENPHQHRLIGVADEMQVLIRNIQALRGLLDVLHKHLLRGLKQKALQEVVINRAIDVGKNPLSCLHALHQPEEPLRGGLTRRMCVPEPLDIPAEYSLQQRINIAVVVVEGIPADAAALHNVLNSDPLHGPFLQQLQESIHNCRFRKSWHFVTPARPEKSCFS